MWRLFPKSFLVECCLARPSLSSLLHRKATWSMIHGASLGHPERCLLVNLTTYQNITLNGLAVP